MTGQAARPAGVGGVFSWAVYDWASSSFNTVIGTFVFSVYFMEGIYGDVTRGTAAWGFAIGISGIIVAVLAPILGSLADRLGRRKPWLAALVLLTILPTALLWFAEPNTSYITYTLVLVVIASVAFELAGAPARVPGEKTHIAGAQSVFQRLLERPPAGADVNVFVDPGHAAGHEDLGPERGEGLGLERRAGQGVDAAEGAQGLARVGDRVVDDEDRLGHGSSVLWPGWSTLSPHGSPASRS